MFIFVFAISCLVCWSCVVAVAPGEAEVVLRFGKPLPAWTEGIHIGWPWPFDRRLRVRVDEVRRLELGGDGEEFITGDRNIVLVRAVVQYRVADPAAFVIAAGGSDAAFCQLARDALVQTLSRHTIDAVLSGGRQALCDEVGQALAARSVALELGFGVLNVNLTSARPPEEVAPDFAAAAAATSRKEQRSLEAKAEAARLLREADAQSTLALEAARADAARVRAGADGEAARFQAIAAEAVRSRRLTMTRLYFETVSALVAKVRRKIVVPSERSVDLNLFGP